MIVQTVTTEQQIRLLKKMIAQIKKQIETTKKLEPKRRYQEKLKKYTLQLKELTMKTAPEESADRCEKDLDTTESTLNSSDSDLSRFSSFSSSNSDGRILPTSGGSTPFSPVQQLSPVARWSSLPRRQPQKQSRRDATDTSRSATDLPYNFIQKSVDKNGYILIKLLKSSSAS